MDTRHSRHSRQLVKILPAAMVLMGLLLLMHPFAPRAQTIPTALLVEIDGAIGPATVDHISRAITEAQARRAVFVVLRIDTPGGLASSMRDIVQDILAAPVPVVGFVAPSGAHAASAGTYILYACHVAAMAPGTSVGAATPVQIGGGRLPNPLSRGNQEDEESEGTQRPTTADKAINDAVAALRSLAQMRGRNEEFAEEAVRKAATLSAEEALAKGVIEILATDTANLLTQLDGREVELSTGPLRLAARGLTLERYAPDWRTRFLTIITNPNVAYILLLIGFYGLLFEFYSPGLVGPGIIGAISLLLALYGFQLLPINYAGLALMLLGLALIAGEIFAPGFGIFGLGGAAAFVIGSILLLDRDIPGFEVSPVLIGSVAAVTSGLFLFVVLMLMRARRRSVVTGPEEMLQSRGEVIEWHDTRGRIRVHGEIWSARADHPLSPGLMVEVTGLDGLTLIVAPQKEEESAS